MDKLELRKKWAEALRSGDYRQCKGTLYNGEGYCCLGVAAKVAGATFKLDPDRGYLLEGHSEYLSSTVVKAYGLRGRIGELSKYLPAGEITVASLAELNDDDWTFEQVADLIEQRPEIVFVD